MATAARQIETASPMPWETFTRSARYTGLTFKRRVWLTAFLATNDATWAGSMAFDAKSPRNAKIVGNECKRSLPIREALAEYAGKSEREVFLESLKDTIRRAEPGSVAQTKAQALYARMKFGLELEMDGRPPRAEESETRAASVAEAAKTFVAKVGDIVLVNGVKHRVTAVDENGKPTDGEPL
jgi:hypothetical protein